MFSNNGINFTNNNNIPFPFLRYAPNNSYNNYFAQNMNQNMSNNSFNRFNPNMNYIIKNPNDIFPPKQEVFNNDPMYSKILVDSLSNNNKSDNKIGNINDNISIPINLRNIIIHISPDEKEESNTDKFYFHLLNFNPIKEEEIREKLEKNNVDENSIKIVLDNMSLKRKKNRKFYLNEGLFYSGEAMSIYYPHIIKDNSKKNYASLFLEKDNNKLGVYDFQYINKTENNDDIFMLTLKLRIKEYNEGKKTNDFGFFINPFGLGYLYTKIPQEIIEDKLKSSNITHLKANFLGNISDRNETYTQDSLENKNFKDNSKYLKKLTFKQIILNIILNGIEYEELPRLILYEYFLNIKGERIVFLGEKKADYPGFNKIIIS